MERLTIEQIKQFCNTTFGREIGKQLSRQVITELIAYKQLEEQIGCPLEVRCNLDLNNKIFDQFGNEYVAKSIGKKDFIAYNCKELNNNKICRELFLWKDYKITWWLKADKSE